MDTYNLIKQLEKTELAYQSTLEINKFKSSYLGKIAHELRSPLSSIMGLHQLIMSDLCEDTEEEREFVTQAYKYCQKLIGLIDQVVEISKIESGKIELDLKPLNVRNILNQIYQSTSLQCANRNLKLVLEEINPTLWIKADEGRLIQSLLILMGTIIDHLDTGNIFIGVENKPLNDYLIITINTPILIQIWQGSMKIEEELDIKKIRDINFSPEMKKILSQTLLQSMGGDLQCQELAENHSSKCLTQLQCLLPLVSL